MWIKRPKIIVGTHYRDLHTLEHSAQLSVLGPHAKRFRYGCVQIFQESSHKFTTPKMFDTVIDMRDKIEDLELQIITHAPYSHNIVGVASKSTEEQLKNRQEANIVGLRNALDVAVLMNSFGKSNHNGVVVVHPSSNGENTDTISNAVYVCKTALQSHSDLTLRVARYLEMDVEEVVSKRRLALEVCSGEGKKFGKTFEELRDIIFSRIPGCEREEDYGLQIQNLGICIDTCHMFASGVYDLSKSNTFQQMLGDLTNLGLQDLVYVLHLNDSKMPFRSRKDRHQTLGCGQIFGKWTEKTPLDGYVHFLSFLYDKSIPVILETPQRNRELDVEFLQEYN